MKASRAAIAATWPIQKRIGEPRLEARPLLGEAGSVTRPKVPCRQRATEAIVGDNMIRQSVIV